MNWPSDEVSESNCNMVRAVDRNAPSGVKNRIFGPFLGPFFHVFGVMVTRKLKFLIQICIVLESKIICRFGFTVIILRF